MSDPEPHGSLLEQRLEIETPERVRIAHDLAGIGSRFAAGAIDVFLLTLVFGVLFVIVAVAYGVARPRTEEAQMALGIAVVGGYFAALSAYYIGFEWAWSGQTPGKRMLKLRAVSQDGGPAPASAIFLRNLLRIVDILPGVAPYGVGGVVMFANARAKRVGDFVAGTVVVRERAEAPTAFAPADPSALPGDALSASDLARVRAFASRSRQMTAASRRDVAHRIAEEIAARHGLAFADAEEFLRVLARGRTPRELRDAQGPRA